MKILIIISFLILATNNLNSLQSERNKSYKNLAVMLAYKPNSEITTKDERNKVRTYKMNHASEEEKNSDNDSGEELNKKLMDFLRQQKLAKHLSELSDKTTVKRENHKRNAASSSSSSLCEASNEDIDDAKIVEINKEKHSCYKNTYKNVLAAFEDALKSQIQSYKKCVCEKKTPALPRDHKTTTTTTTSTTTTEAPDSDEGNIGQRSLHGDDDELSENGKVIQLGNEKELESAAHHPDDIICFHKQYAFMLNKLLDRIPCERKSDSNLPSDIVEFTGETNVRNERNNVPILDESLESFELDVSSIATQRESEKKSTTDDELRNTILAVLKEHLNAKKVTNESGKKRQKTTTTTTPAPESDEEEDISNEEEFLMKLKKLFHQLESAEQSFPVSNGKSINERTSSMPAQKSGKKSKSNANEIADDDYRKSKQQQFDRKPRKSQHASSVVSERSDESTEISIKLKNSKPEKQYSKPKENIRENAKNSSITHHSSSKNSYRTASRASKTIAADPKRNRNSSKETEKTTPEKIAKNSSTHDDDRFANDLAKALSDYARKYMKA